MPDFTFDYCPLFRMTFSAPLHKLTIKPALLPADDFWIEGAYDEQISATLKLSLKHGQVMLTGRIYGRLDLECGRTLLPFDDELDVVVREVLHFAEEPDLLENGVLRVAEWVRQQVALHTPLYPVHPAVAGADVLSFYRQEEPQAKKSPFSCLEQLKLRA